MQSDARAPARHEQHPRALAGGRFGGDELGFSLLEAIAATVIAVIAALGLAYTFGIGRANVNRFEVARTADAVAQSRMEMLGVLAAAPVQGESLQVGTHPDAPNAFASNGRTIGQEYWRVDMVPAESLPPPIQGKLVKITAVVAWTLGGITDSVTYHRLVARP